jgi:hypothetical protein
MATTELVAAYHEPLVKKYIRYNYTHFTPEQYSAVEEIAKTGGIEMCVMHELALSKHLGIKRESGAGYDLICEETERTYEAKYKRLVNNRNKGGDYWLMKLGTKELQGKNADYVWITVYNQFIDNEDHFMIPLKDMVGKSFNFSYNKEKDSYNQGQRYHVRRGFFDN